MAHGPQRVQGDPVRIMHGYQAVAALAIASIQDDVGHRLSVLQAIAAATDDWASAAAVLGLKRVVELHPSSRREVARFLRCQVPSEDEPLHCAARAIAFVGFLTADDARPFLRLRGRVLEALEVRRGGGLVA